MRSRARRDQTQPKARSSGGRHLSVDALVNNRKRRKHTVNSTSMMMRWPIKGKGKAVPHLNPSFFMKTKYLYLVFVPIIVARKYKDHKISRPEDSVAPNKPFESKRCSLEKNPRFCFFCELGFQFLPNNNEKKNRINWYASIISAPFQNNTKG